MEMYLKEPHLIEMSPKGAISNRNVSKGSHIYRREKPSGKRLNEIS